MTRGTVLVVSQHGGAHVGGAERYVQHTNLGLSQRGWDVRHLCAQAQSSDFPLASPWAFLSGGYHPAWHRQVREVIAQWRPRVLLAHQTVPALVDVAVRSAARCGVPVCLVAHGDLTGPDLLRRVLGTLYHGLWGRATLDRARVVFVGAADHAAASPQLAAVRARCIVAPPGVDAAMVEAGLRGLAPAQPPYVLFVGKPDVPSKGFGVLLKAWEQARAVVPELELVVAGSGARGLDRPGLRRLGHVASREALAELYAAATVTVLPSRSRAESFGMVLAEALAAGCPVVASRIGGLSARVDHGRTGLLVPPGQVAPLAEALVEAVRLAGTWRAQVAAHRADHVACHDWSATTDLIDGVLQSQ